MTSTHTRRTAAVSALAVSGLAVTALAASAGAALATTGPEHTSLSIRSAHDAVKAGGKDTISGNLHAKDGSSTAGLPVTLEAAAKGAKSFTATQTATTGSGGSAVFTVTPAATTRYKLVFAGDATDHSTHSGVVTVTVGADKRHATSLSIRTAKHVIAPGAKDTISGDLRGRGHGLADRTVVLQAKAPSAKGWSRARVKKTGTHGGVAFVVSPAADRRFRLVFRGAKHLRPSHSGVVQVDVKTASSLSIAETTVAGTPGATITGTLSSDGTAIASQPVVLVGRAAGAKKFTKVDSGETGSDGSVTFSVDPSRTTHYELVYRGSGTYAATRTKAVTVSVPAPSSLSIRANHSQITSGQRDVISGSLVGGGKGLKGRTVTLMERPSDTADFTQVASKKTGKDGYVGFAEKATSTETYELVFAGGSSYTGCQSGLVTVTVAS